MGGQVNGGVKTFDVTGVGVKSVPSYLMSEAVVTDLYSVFHIFLWNILHFMDG